MSRDNGPNSLWKPQALGVLVRPRPENDSVLPHPKTAGETTVRVSIEGLGVELVCTMRMKRIAARIPGRLPAGGSRAYARGISGAGSNLLDLSNRKTYPHFDLSAGIATQT
jgi:hypothetical protein